MTAQADADSRQAGLAGNLASNSFVVVGFIALQIGEPSRAVGDNVGVPFSTGLDGIGTEILCPFRLALDNEVPSSGIRGANSPARVHGKGCRDLVEGDADFRGDVGPNRIRLELPRRCFGI